MSKQSISIAYITELFPSLTQTFVYREVLALRERGVPIHTFSVWPSDPADLSAEAVPLIGETFYIFPIFWFSLILVHLKYLFSRPLLYLGTLAFVLTRPGEPLRNRWRSLLHFLYGVLAIREIERLKIQHIHAHFGWSASSIALIASRLLNIPFSLTLHAHGIYVNRLLLGAKIRYSRFVVTISEYNRQFLKKLFPEMDLEDKIHIIHCGLDPDVFVPSSEPSHGDDELTIVGVGNLAPRKGFHVLIEACHHLAERGVPFRCHILGEGEERARLEALIDRYNLHGRVLLPGRVYQEGLRQILKQADVSVLPCVKRESGELDGIPVALMETMAMQIPTVSTNISGVPELIDHERNGLLTSPGDAVALADALQRLRDYPELRQQLGRAGRETVVNDFNIYRSAEQMCMLFEQVFCLPRNEIA
jgi:colanic acid/amylovoran biosynthesis glycosyltransferase